MNPVKAIVTELLDLGIEWPSPWEMGADEFAFRASGMIHKQSGVEGEQAEHIAVCVWQKLREVRVKQPMEA